MLPSFRQGLCFWHFAGRSHRKIRIRIRIAANSRDTMPLRSMWLSSIRRERKISPKFFSIKFSWSRDIPTQIAGHAGHSLSKTTEKGALHQVFVWNIPGPESGISRCVGPWCRRNILPKNFIFRVFFIPGFWANGAKSPRTGANWACTVAAWAWDGAKGSWETIVPFGQEDVNGEKLTVKKNGGFLAPIFSRFGADFFADFFAVWRRFFHGLRRFFTVCKGHKRWKKKHLVIDDLFHG